VESHLLSDVHRPDFKLLYMDLSDGASFSEEMVPGQGQSGHYRFLYMYLSDGASFSEEMVPGQGQSGHYKDEKNPSLF
jgi:hypothetical protein